jgi:putative FmdB family regulatory protein
LPCCVRGPAMPEYDFYCHACNRPFSKTLTPAEYEEGSVSCPHCGSEEVEQRWFYAAEARHSA